MKKKYILFIVAIVFVMADLSYSFVQYYNESMDGDMTDIILPSPRCEDVLNDPFGWTVLSEQKKYVGPNRYFAHQLMSSYFKNAPIALQRFTSPVESVYLSSAIFKLITHLLLLGMISLYCISTLQLKREYWIIPIILLVPLFQTYGYNRSVGLVLHSITYTFFYSFPLALLLIFFWPFWKKLNTIHFRFSIPKLILSCLLVVVLCFNGPLITPLAILLCSGSLLYLFWNNFKKKKTLSSILISLKLIPKQIFIPFLFFIVLALYSFYIGTFNAESSHENSLSERYATLPFAFYYQFTRKIGFPLLILFIIINTILLNRAANNATAQKLLRQLKWIVFFSLVFILLLPLGGYRSYRPNVLRTDTIMPIIICLFYYFSASSTLLFSLLQRKQKQFYIGGITILLFIFTIADEPNFHTNDCEKNALIELSKNDKLKTELKANCSIMTWEKINWKGQYKYNRMLLRDWNIIK